MGEKSENKKYQRNRRLTWDEFFMTMAIAAAERTACIYHQVGSVFVDNDKRVVSVGYNGPTVGDLHCIEDGCAKIHGDPETGEIRRCRGSHSEINGIINSGNTERLKNSTLYVTLFPCYDCMKSLNNLGIKKIIYLDEYLRVKEGTDGTVKEPEPEARSLANKRGIVCEKFRGKINFKSDYFKTDIETATEILKRVQDDTIEELRF